MSATVLHKRTMSVRIPPVNSPCSRTLRLCTYAQHNESCESLGEKLGWDSNLIKSFKREHNVSFQPHYCGQRGDGGGGRSWAESTRLFMQEGHGEAASPLSSASLCGVYWEWANKCDDVTQILIISAAGKKIHKYINKWNVQADNQAARRRDVEQQRKWNRGERLSPQT